MPIIIIMSITISDIYHPSSATHVISLHSLVKIYRNNAHIVNMRYLPGTICVKSYKHELIVNFKRNNAVRTYMLQMSTDGP